MKHVLLTPFVILSMTLWSTQAIAETEIIGKVGVEGLNFFQAPVSDEQESFYGSMAIEPELYHPIDEQSELKAKLFYRYDAQS